jgi:hypothetical protein
MKPVSSPPHSQEPATCPYSEPDQSSPRPPVLLLKNSSLNISVEAEVCSRRSEQSYSCPGHEATSTGA